MKSLSSTYAEFILKTAYDDLPPIVIARTKERMLDLIGVALAGYALMEFPRVIVSHKGEVGGREEASVIGGKERIPAPNAAFANAVCAHALDMDDGHRLSALHPGAVIIPAVVAAAEKFGAATREVIVGIVVGYEIMTRIGMAINPSNLMRGFHSTGVVGPFGAAAAVSKVMMLDHEESVGALGLAGLQGCGLLGVTHDSDGAKVKPINPANAAKSGLLSCILAREGFKGPLRILEGEDGFLQAFSDETNRERLVSDLGEEYEICNAYTKLYAACRHCHPAIDAALEVVSRVEIDVSEIQEIYVSTYSAAVRIAGMARPTTGSAAKFSIPFCVALAITEKDAGIEGFSERRVMNPKIQSLAQKVRLTPDSRWDRTYPFKRGATVSIVDNKGNRWSADVELAKGEPENPVSRSEVYDKFFSNATLLISEEEAKELAKTIENLENHSISDLTGFLRAKDG